MPLYEYHCKDCNDEFEVLIRGEESPECPGCHGSRLEKLLSIPAAHVASSEVCSGPACGAPEMNACGMGPCGTGGCPIEM